MAYVRPGSTAKRHATDLLELRQIAEAVSYTIHFRKSPTETFNEAAPTMDAARAAEARLNAEHGRHGRRAMIYAVTAQGKHLPLQS